MRYLVIGFICFIFASNVLAQPAFGCGGITGLSVIHDRVDSAGFAPRMKTGSENQFNCIATRDPYFNSQRFQSYWQSANYWNGLLSKEIGQTIGELPPPIVP